MKKSKICFFILLALVLALGTFAKSAPSEAKTLDIGDLVTLTGPGSESEILVRDGTALAAEWINSKGGINIKGEKYLINLIVQDQKGSAEGAVAAATKLVEQHKLKFIVGATVPFIVIANISVTEPAKAMLSMVWNSGLPEQLSPKTPHTFYSGSGILDAITVVYDYLVKTYPNAKKVAIVGPDDASFPIAITESKKCSALGLKVIATETYPWGTQDYYPVMTKILASKPDAIGQIAGFPPMIAGVLKAARELGFTGPVFASNITDMYLVRDLVGGKLATNFFNASPVLDNPNMTPMVKEMRRLALAKYGKFGLDNVMGWDPLWCMVQAIEAAQSLDPTEVAKTWEKMGKIDTLFGAGKMGGLKTFGANHVVIKPVPISRIMNGNVEWVEWGKAELP